MTTSQAQILEYALKNSPFYGWGTEMLENACKSAGLDRNYWKIDFPDGGIDVIDYFNQKCNEKLAADLRVNDQRTGEKIRTAVKYRIGMNDKQQIQSILGVYALHPLHATKAIYETVDTIWRLTGDTATDWNFYSKRLLLAGVYSTTLMFWLSSEDDKKTWMFLDRRLAEVGRLGKGIATIKTQISRIIPSAI